MIGINVSVPFKYDRELIKAEISAIIGKDYDKDVRIIRKELISDGDKP